MTMKFLTKSLLSAGAAAAALVSVAAPAQARHRDNDGISAGEVIAGAVVLGGIAAVIAASDNDRDRNYHDRNYRYDDRRYDRDYRRGDNRYGYDYNRYGNSRQAVNQCVNAVENWANRYSRSDVTQINDIDRTRYGYRVSGNVVVKDGYHGRDRYDRGYHRGSDRGRFTCYVERGRVIDVDYRGLDQWR
jgi:hypothetical protein